MVAEEGAPAAGRPLRWWTYLLAFAVFCALMALGTWQLQRMHWKEALLADIEARRSATPMDLADVERQFAATADVDYQAMRAAGRFVHDKEQFFFATFRGETGYYVYTPLRLADGRYLFVNRGFVPYDLKERARRPVQPETEVRVVGLARNPLDDKPSFMVPDNDPDQNIYYWKDIRAMMANAGLDPADTIPFFMDADATPNPGGLPVGGVTLVDLPNRHLQYVVTWYGLAATFMVVFIVFAMRGRKAAKP